MTVIADDITTQRPLNTGLSWKTTAKDAIADFDLHGKTIIITGGNSGIGLEAVRVLAAAGARVIVPVRNLEKAKEILEGIPNLELEIIDLLDPLSIDSFSARFLASGRALDILINNAGIMGTPLKRDKRGYETHFAVNHLGHFHLTARLWPALTKANQARVVAVSSRAHRRNGVVFEDPNFIHTAYDNWKAYAQSKTANSLFAVELDRLGRKYGVRAFAVHPGLIPATGISRYIMESRIRSAGLKKNIRWLLDNLEKFHLVSLVNLFIREPANRYKTNSQGAATMVWCAISDDLDEKGGVYCEDCDIAEAVTAASQKPSGVKPWAIDPDSAKRLWQISEGLTGVKFEITEQTKH